MNLELITAPQELPVTLAQARLHLKITTSTEDANLLSLLEAAVEHAQTYTRRRFITQTWDWRLDCFPSFGIEVPHAPLQSVTYISYLDNAGATQTVSVADYVVDAKSQPGRITPAFGKFWPTTREQINAVTVRFVCGYGLGGAVPYPIKSAILLLLQYFEGREGDETLLKAGERLLQPYRVVRF